METPVETKVWERLAALGDPTRLRLIALLARRPHCGEELAEVLGIRAATVSHHLRRLRVAGLVRAERQTPYVLFRLRRSAWEELTEALERPETLASRLGLPDEETMQRATVAAWLDDQGRLRHLPRGRRLRATLLRWAASHLQTGRLYPERELRHVLLGVGSDPDTLRDELLRCGWLQRAGTVYRRLEEVDER